MYLTFYIFSIPIFAPDAFRKHMVQVLMYKIKKRSQELAQSITNNTDLLNFHSTL